MKSTSHRSYKKNWISYGLLGIVIAGYLGVMAFAPQSQNTLNLTPLQLFLLRLSVTIPYLFSWVVAVYGLTTLGNYLRSLKTATVTASTLRAMYRGLVWIVLGTITTALLSSLRTALPDYYSTFTVVINYMYVFPLLIGFWLMYRGLRQSADSEESTTKRPYRKDTIIKTLMVLIVTSFYAFLVFTNPNRQVDVGTLVRASYYLPDLLIVVTLIIPVFITWWLGFSVAFLMSDVVTRSVDSNTFKAQTRILYGIWAIIFTSILLQALLSLGTTRLLSIGLGPLIAIIYIFLGLQGGGYVLLSLGVRKLTRGKAGQ